MSRVRRISTIAKKELVEFVRDWRTIVAILVIPLLMFPLLFILFPILLESEAAELDAMEVDVAIQTDGIPDELGVALNSSSLNITYDPLPNLEQLSEPQDDVERLRNGSVDVVLRMQTNGTIVEYALLYMSTSEQSL